MSSDTIVMVCQCPGPNIMTMEAVLCIDDTMPIGRHCLVAADTDVLQNASGTVSTTMGYFGSFAFLPVIDDDYIQERPSVQLLEGGLTGKRALIGVS